MLNEHIMAMKSATELILVSFLLLTMRVLTHCHDMLSKYDLLPKYGFTFGFTSAM
jgi:hypothetical protein